ncbi:DUF86 domain-containing protein [Alkalimonas sp. NCh-2]|uniref:HepT-like ribonuclease domain-containing protein n=1 Tax=Alkalimonas sp. NCh-2 TaxID=3144846 RepID=UPI0031F710EF
MSGKLTRLYGYLGHITEAIQRIESYTEDMDELSFLDSELVQDAVIRNLEVIGEASRNIEKHFPEFTQAHPDLPLAYAYQMRNALAHGYFKIDFEIVWKTIEQDLPALHQQITLLQLKS